jgi:hypothetical protein
MLNIVLKKHEFPILENFLLDLVVRNMSLIIPTIHSIKSAETYRTTFTPFLPLVVHLTMQLPGNHHVHLKPTIAKECCHVQQWFSARYYENDD